MQKGNWVLIIGTISAPITIEGKMCHTTISIKRNSGVIDTLLLDMPRTFWGRFKEGDKVEVAGEFVSRNVEGHLQLSVLARHVLHTGEKDKNWIELEGYVCKKPIYRTTPLQREITELFIAINRTSGTTDYIPCIAWERNAKNASYLELGDRIAVTGRIQSRQYIKLANGEEILRTVHEVSVSRMTVCERGGQAIAAT